MKVCLNELTEKECREFRYGVTPSSDIYFIPYTGWGNTVTTHIYSEGLIINKPVAIDWQWGGSEDRYPDGEVFETLKDAEKYSSDLGFPIILALKENDIANPCNIGSKITRK